jgi:serine/threonine protein kinase
MATVHRATIEIGGGVIKEVALKRMLPQLVDDKKTLDDFIREAKLAAHLNHPNIVRILELGRNASTYFIAMELVRGHSLLQLMKLMTARKMTAPIGIVVAVLAELCDALDYASAAPDAEGQTMEIVHRDLSPSNLIIDTEGHLKIIDFGVAKSVNGHFATSSGLVKGKLGYMALEVLAGKPVDKRADIFSVGVVAWEMLTGRRLFTAANEYDVITKIRKGATVPPSALNDEVSPELDEIVMHALSRKRDERWPSAGVMKRALDTLRRTHREGPREVSAWRRALVPEAERFDEDSTTMERVSLRELMINPSQPSIITATTQIPQVPDFEHYVNHDEDDDAPTQMTKIPERPSQQALITEPHVAALPPVTEQQPALSPPLGTDTAFDALPSRDSFAKLGSQNNLVPRDTIIGHDSEAFSREPDPLPPPRDTLMQDVVTPREDD